MKHKLRVFTALLVPVFVLSIAFTLPVYADKGPNLSTTVEGVKADQDPNGTNRDLTNRGPEKAIDGDTNTVWGGNAGPRDSEHNDYHVDDTWIALDYGSDQTFNFVELYWGEDVPVRVGSKNYNGKNYNGYAIEISEDGVNYTKVKNQTFSIKKVSVKRTESRGDDVEGYVDFYNDVMDTVSFPAVTARFVRLSIFELQTKEGPLLGEFAVYLDGAAATSSTAVSSKAETSSVQASSEVSVVSNDTSVLSEASVPETSLETVSATTSADTASVTVSAKPTPGEFSWGVVIVVAIVAVIAAGAGVALFFMLKKKK